MYLAKELTQKSLPEIGELFGGRDHTTVLHAVRKISGERQQLTEAQPAARTCSNRPSRADRRSTVKGALATSECRARYDDRTRETEEEVSMIVLKATQDKVLAALQSVAGIVERRHTLADPGQRADPQDRRPAAADDQRPGNPDPHHGRAGRGRRATSPRPSARAS